MDCDMQEADMFGVITSYQIARDYERIRKNQQEECETCGGTGIDEWDKSPCQDCRGG